MPERATPRPLSRQDLPRSSSVLPICTRALSRGGPLLLQRAVTVDGVGQFALGLPRLVEAGPASPRIAALPFTLRWGPHRLRLDVDTVVAGAAAARLLGVEDVPLAARPFSPTEQGLLGAVLASVLVALDPGPTGDDGGRPVRLELPGEGPLELGEAVGLELPLALADVKGSCTLWTSVAGARAIADERTGRGRNEVPALAWRDLALALHLVLATTELAAGELATLEPGDVVVCTGSGAPGLPHVPLRLRLGTWHAPAVLDASAGALRLTDKTSRFQPGAEMPAAKPLEPADASAATYSHAELLAQAPVRVTVELATLELPIAELTSLIAGGVVTTPDASLARVRLIAGGRVLAFGEVVDVGGELGVRVTELAAKP